MYCDIDEAENEMYFEVELPGVHKDDVDLRVYEQGLFIRGETENVIYTANWTFPDIVDPEATRAEYDNGLLIIHAPFVSPVKEAERIAVQ